MFDRVQSFGQISSNLLNEIEIFISVSSDIDEVIN